MSDNTKISWADASWNPIIGCSKISSGCEHCYAERMACRQMWMEINRCKKDPRRLPEGWMKYSRVIHAGTGRWKGTAHFVESTLTKPLHWKKPRKIFVNSMGDTWHESVPFEWIDRIMAVAALCPQHTFLFLTKRAGRMREYPEIVLSEQVYCENRSNKGTTQTRICHEAYKIIHARQQTDKPNYDMWNGVWPLENIHCGVTIENQDNIGRILDLVKTPRTEGFISFEPLLGRIDCPKIDAIGRGPKNILEDISYAFIGCESGSGARLCSLDDIRYIMQQCRGAGVKIHIKQLPLDGKCNKHFDEWPTEFQVREI